MLALTFFTSLSLTLLADAYDDARSLMEDGDYSAARDILLAELENSPKTSKAGAIYQSLGECDFEEGNYSSALQYFNQAKAKKINDANLYLGRLAFMDYNFAEASKLYSLYRKGLKKGTSANPELSIYEKQLTEAENFLERVEKLTVIDSISVDADNFFKAIKLPASSGRLRTPDKLPFPTLRDGVDMVFANENEDFIMWAAPDSIGNMRIMESVRLADGKWSEPVMTPEDLAGGGECNYPVMMADGTTLYFASDGDGSIGGYDIFVASRDATSGEYMQPSNLGMPYNSPYDDYLLAIDEENGIGWLATDRNQLPGLVTLYVYKVNDMRENYEPAHENITDFARLTDFKSTQDPEEDLSEILYTIANIQTDTKPKHIDFHFPMRGGKDYTELSDFRSPSAREAMKKYLSAKKTFETMEEDLRNLRKEYHKKESASLRERIIILEDNVAKRRQELTNLRNEVYKAEK